MAGVIERQHPKAIALGLDRVAAVLERMQIALRRAGHHGRRHNGKGSCCALLEAMLRAGGYRTGLYTSPHLVALGRSACASPGAEPRMTRWALVRAGKRRVAGITPNLPLTYFEYGTLAAALAVCSERIDAAILEVGLGGRLDAVNVIDPDCAVLTSVGIDHVRLPRPDASPSAAEKAGISAAGRAAVIAEPDPPRSVLAAPG